MKPPWGDLLSSDSFEPEPTPSRLLAVLSDPIRLFIIVTITFSVLGGLLQELGAERTDPVRRLPTGIVLHVAGNLVASGIAILFVLMARRSSGSVRRASVTAAASGGAIGGAVRLPLETLAGTDITVNGAIASVLTEAAWFVIAAVITNVTVRLARNESEMRTALTEALSRQTNMRTQMLNADLETRRDVAEWLHGHLQAELLLAAEEAHGMGASGDAVAARITRLRDDDLRTFAHSLHPTLAELNLIGALKDLVRRYSTSTEVTVSADATTTRQALPPGVAVAMYRTCEEAIGNAVKHGGAQQVSITLTQERSAGRLTLRIDDDGTGRPDSVEPGLGLTLIDTYVRTVGGTWDLQFGPATGATGATLTVTVPLPAPDVSDRLPGDTAPDR
jgi:two-component system sensor histidine kinase UhpB